MQGNQTKIDEIVRWYYEEIFVKINDAERSLYEVRKVKLLRA